MSLIPPLSGQLVPGGHELFIRVYYEDTDFSGLVYHANYVKFFERGRTDFLRLLDIHHTDLAAGVYQQPLVFAVRTLHVDFLKPARLDDVLKIFTKPVEFSGARIQLSQFAYRDDDLLARAEVTVVVLSPDGRPKRMPPEIESRLSSASQQIADEQ